MKQPAVYLMASQRNGTLYLGVTSDLIKRVWQHRSHVVEGFTEKYNVDLLVWFEQHDTMESAITREKAIKKWNRAWKLNLIEKTNPGWEDLWPTITGEALDSRLRGNDGNLQTVLTCPIAPIASVIPAQAGIQRGETGEPQISPIAPVIPAQAGIQKGATP